MSDVFVHPRWTRDTFGGVDSVITETALGDRWTVTSDPDTDLMGWWIAGYTEAIVTVKNLSPVSRVSVQFEGSLDRENWVNLPTYNRVTDTFNLSTVLSALASMYETLESDRWHFLRVKARPYNLADADSYCSIVIAIGAATI